MLRLDRTLLALLLTLTLIHGVSAISFGQRATSGPVEYSLRSTAGQTVTSGSLKGKPVVLAFGASWLPLSRQQLQGLKKVGDEYGNKVAVYWVSTESESQKSKNYASDEQLNSFARKYAPEVTVLRDPDGAISKKLGADQIPSIVILDKQGVPVGEPIKGFNPEANLADQIGKQLDSVL